MSISGKEIARRIAVKITPSCRFKEMANNQSVRRHLTLLPEVESLGEVGGRPQCDKCGCRVRIAHSIVSRLWRQFQTKGTAIRGIKKWSSTRNHTRRWPVQCLTGQKKRAADSWRNR
ncbi:hypothetical protein TNCV_2743561 [Trichonephila clavipes]|nr:hypothetical protein TNCV_2743561 [Trichonephila clavipes]